MNQGNYRLDLHTHSIISHDGGIRINQYRKILASSQALVAITDHNKVELALKLREELGERVIVGEEIMTQDGEIIGLFLTKLIPRKLSAEQTIEEIRSQNGLVYIPHPLEKTRKGLSMKVLEQIASKIDIIEVYNARSLEPRRRGEVVQFAKKHNLAVASSSDAHSLKGFGTAYSQVGLLVTRENLVELLKSAELVKNAPPVLSRFAPAINKIRKLFFSE